MLKKFILWYLLKKCSAVLEYEGKVIRVFSKEFYDTEVIDYLNAMKRTRIGEDK